MDEFKTKLDNQTLDISVTVSSDALMDGSSKIFITIYHEDHPRRWRKIDAFQDDNNVFSASIEKSRLSKRPILKIRTNFIVDTIDLKDAIVKTSTCNYLLKDELNEASFTSNYQDNENEFDLGKSDDETFSISKKIHIELT
ncbi:hypothetical protein JAO71_02135 [Olleya sp. YSTF-M6]|uniref:Uncharacterized protein n=1 Tax=Olleya sediminilitoris TaxID=2795739 RepID=A0ABS1WHK3_9FLAO|nr:hypothetical protein [Olleya sediminilitoris]MBL7558588.1 hypothetical protein [Olleya sediminilitoris]